jgi:RNA polymerase sigma-70 factor, ECF subfamily
MTQVALRGPEAALDPAPDEAVVRDVVAGDAARFEILMRRHNQRLFRTARSILRDDAEAEDAVQQAYLAAYLHLGEFRGEASFSTWMTRITVREALRRLRQNGRHGDLHLVDEEHEADMTATRSPEDDTADRELRAVLERGIDALPRAIASSWSCATSKR